MWGKRHIVPMNQLGPPGMPQDFRDLAAFLADDPRRVLASGEIGEIRIRGPNVMVGYWKQPEETEKAITPE